eukprot:PhF_6_TR6782/c0_g1_i2/m.9762
MLRRCILKSQKQRPIPPAPNFSRFEQPGSAGGRPIPNNNSPDLPTPKVTLWQQLNYGFDRSNLVSTLSMVQAYPFGNFWINVLLFAIFAGIYDAHYRFGIMDYYKRSAL